MRTIERNGESKLKQKLPTPASRDNVIKTDVVVVVRDHARRSSQLKINAHPNRT